MINIENIQMMELELIGDVNIYVGIGIQIVVSLFMGGVVGLDRELKMKAAGLRTNILICIGACLYTTISMIVSAKTDGAVDPNRVAAQIASGIGFLGAGAIIQSRGHIVGLTTAATIWVVASIGYTIGAGYPISATIFTLTVLVVLKIIRPINSWIEKTKDNRYYHIEVLSRGTIKRWLSESIFNESSQLDEIYEEVVDKERNKRITHVYLSAHPRALDRIINRVNESIRVEKVNFQKVKKVNTDIVMEGEH